MGKYPSLCNPGRGDNKIRILTEIQTGEMTKKILTEILTEETNKKEFTNRIQC